MAVAMLMVVLTWLDMENIPRLSLVTSALFVASLIHVPVGPTSVHLVLSGLAGVLLGPAAFLAVFISVLLQTLLFQHGGITTIGINTLNIGVGSLLAWGIFALFRKFLRTRILMSIVGGLAGGLAVLFAIIFSSFCLYLTDSELFGLIGVMVVSHIPVMVVESVLVGSTVAFLYNVKPEMVGVIKNGRVQ